MKWLPIETAPKDGTQVLVCFYDDYGVNKRWRIEVSEWGQWGGSEGWLIPDTQCGGYWTTDATHWMPLPALPDA